jgi:hypothetical protein
LESDSPRTGDTIDLVSDEGPVEDCTMAGAQMKRRDHMAKEKTRVKRWEVISLAFFLNNNFL